MGRGGGGAAGDGFRAARKARVAATRPGPRRGGAFAGGLEMWRPVEMEAGECGGGASQEKPR